LKDMWSALKKECTSKKEPEPFGLPPDCLHGSYCFCLTRKSDMGGTESTMRNYLHELVKKYPESKAVPSFFYLGDNWEIQQRGWEIFAEAFKATREEVCKSSYEQALEPFNEGEAVKILLRNVARSEFAPKFRAATFSVPIDCIQNHLYSASDNLCLGIVESTVTAGWPPIQMAVDAVKDKILKTIDSGAAKLVGELKPVIAKILALVQSKLKKKSEEKEEPQRGPQFGDVVSKWQFQRSEIGKQFWENLNKHDAREAMNALRDNSETAMEQFLQAKMASGLKAVLGDKTASLEIVQVVMEAIAEQIVKTLQKFTTLKPLMKGAEKLFDCRLELEKDLCANRTGGADAIAKSLEFASKNMWKTLPGIGLRLFIDIYNIKGNIESSLSGVCDEGKKPLTDVTDALYTLQMKALNALRVQLINQLKTRLPSMSGSDDQVKECVRTTWRELTFNIIGIVMKETWVQLCEAFTVSCIEQVKEKFNKDIWPPIKEGLNEIQSLIPAQLSDMGLKIEPMALKVSTIIIEKGVRWAMTKLLLKVEATLFTQF